MKSLQESLFDRDLVQKDVKVISLLDLIKGKVYKININTGGIPLFKMFPGNTIAEMKRDYKETIIPSKRFKSSYEKHYGILNAFFNYILDNTHLTSADYKDNNLDPTELKKDLNSKSKIPVRFTFYRHELNGEVIGYILYISAEDINITVRFDIKGLSVKDYYAVFGEVKEGLFDKDLVQKEVPGHQLKDIVFFDGQWVYRIRNGSRVTFDGGVLMDAGVKGMNVLEVIDWKKVKQDLKKWNGDKIDLGLYAYANPDKYIMRTTETNKKTEEFAQLILSIPFVEEYHFGSYNSRFRDEFEKKLNEYILPQWKDGFYWNVDCQSKFGLNISLRYIRTDLEWLRFEFIKYSD